jgi:hypothetical protein
LDYTYLDTTTDYYALLGVEVDAPASDIKAAFKKLALQYHPDVYKGEDAHERMRVLLQAYQTLNEPSTRREYDMLHAVRVAYTTQSETTNSENTIRPVAPRRPHANTSEISPSARRDRQRHYDFPILQESRNVHIDLVDMTYNFSPDKAYVLQQQGLLRGNAPETSDHAYYCHRCHHHWHESSARNGTAENILPLSCPKCRAGDWTEYLLLRCVHCCAVFESEQIRYEVGTYTYGKKTGDKTVLNLCPPYELFPLCPFCGTARWCPAENTRVEDLRLRQAKRDAMMRLLWVGITLFAIVVLGVLALGAVH